MTALLAFALAAAFVVIVIVSALLMRSTRMLLTFDELFEMLDDDISTNVKYLDKLISMPLFMDSQEIRTAHGNMMIIRKRLDEFLLRIEEERHKGRGA